MSISGKESRAVKGRHERRDAGGSQVPAPSLPPSGDGDGFFSDKAWVGIGKKLGLSPREAEITRCIVTGQGDKEIARRLDVSPRTIQTHLERLRAKLGAENRVDLVARVFAAHNKWRSEPPLLPQQAVRKNTDIDTL
jgi:DNA-binding CsgD family transcriptional regulator